MRGLEVAREAARANEKERSSVLSQVTVTAVWTPQARRKDGAKATLMLGRGSWEKALLPTKRQPGWDSVTPHGVRTKSGGWEIRVGGGRVQ